LHPFIFKGRTAEHRHDRHRDRSLADRGDQLVRRDRIGILEELLHQGVVYRRDLFDQLSAPFGGFGLHVFGNLLVSIVYQIGLFRIVVNNSPIIYKVYQTGEFVFGPDRQNDRQRIGSETLLDLSANVQEIGAGTVHFIYVTDTRHAVLVGLTPYGFGLGFHAAHGAERGHRTVQHAQRTFHLGGEVHVTRGVDDIDLIGLIFVLPKSGRRSRSDGNTTFLLLNHPVHRSGTFVHLADFMGFSRVEKDTFRSSRFTGIDVSHDPDISRIC